MWLLTPFLFLLFLPPSIFPSPPLPFPLSLPPPCFSLQLLAKKVFTLYSLAVQQLSKQDHYDFGLRALTSLLRYAGKKRRVCPDVADEEILLMSMKDMNIAKLASVDLPLFNGIIQDLFPAVETPTIDYGKLRETIEAELRQACLQVTPFTLTKVIQLYETKNSRHSTMIVGKTGSGKTVTWRTLQSTLTTMHRKGEPGFNLVRVRLVCLSGPSVCLVPLSGLSVCLVPLSGPSVCLVPLSGLSFCLVPPSGPSVSVWSLPLARLSVWSLPLV
ncbi:unnamed protein product, partial [Oncorhynchus mykiss]